MKYSFYSRAYLIENFYLSAVRVHLTANCILVIVVNIIACNLLKPSGMIKNTSIIAS